MRLRWLLLIIVLVSIFFIYRRSQSVNTISTMIPGWKGYLIEGEKYSVEGMRFNLPSGTPVYAPENVEVTTVGFSANSTLIVLNSEKREFRIWIGGKNILVTQREYLEKGGTIGYVEDFAADPENPDVNMMLFVKTWK